MERESARSTSSAAIAKAPAFTIPALPENKRDFLKWENELKAYLNFYGETDRILTNDEKDPPEPQQEDYLDETGMLPDDFEIRLENDRKIWNENKADFRTRSRFLATTLVQACHNNKKGSELISSVKPGDWKSIWEILRITIVQWVLRTE